MNQRTRARALQHKTDLTYQQALTFVRQHGNRAVRIRWRVGKSADLGEIDLKLLAKLRAKGDFSPRKRRHNAKSKGMEVR